MIIRVNELDKVFEPEVVRVGGRVIYRGQDTINCEFDSELFRFRASRGIIKISSIEGNGRFYFISSEFSNIEIV